MKRIVFAVFLWLLIAFSVSKIITVFIEPIELQIYLFTIDLLISTILSIQISKLLFPNKSYVVNTNLGPSGTISGPTYDLPKNFTIIYESAQKPPTIAHIYDAFNQYEGFLVQFGNGVVGYSNGNIRTKIGVPDTGLKLTVRSNGTTIKLG